MKFSTKCAGVLSTCALAAAMLIGLGVPAQAHGGGLDWQGGHNCRVGSCAGEYHCHQARGGICAKNKPSQPKQKRYANCREARAAGTAPIFYPSALYDLNRHLDRDRDGVACE